MVGKKHSGEADQLTLASVGSEHVQLFSEAISWGNKMNFTLYANMAGFCSDSHIFNCTVLCTSLSDIKAIPWQLRLCLHSNLNKKFYTKYFRTELVVQKYSYYIQQIIVLHM